MLRTVYLENNICQHFSLETLCCAMHKYFLTEIGQNVINKKIILKFENCSNQGKW